MNLTSNELDPHISWDIDVTAQHKNKMLTLNAKCFTGKIIFKYKTNFNNSKQLKKPLTLDYQQLLKSVKKSVATNKYITFCQTIKTIS